MNPAVLVVAVFFAAMGFVALGKPERIWRPFGATPDTPAARNEVRAVYGGFGLAIGCLLAVVDEGAPDQRAGVLLAVAVALFGMAAGRLIAAAVEPASLKGFPAVFLIVEAALGGLLLLAR